MDREYLEGAYSRKYAKNYFLPSLAAPSETFHENRGCFFLCSIPTRSVDGLTPARITYVPMMINVTFRRKAFRDNYHTISSSRMKWSLVCETHQSDVRSFGMFCMGLADSMIKSCESMLTIVRQAFHCVCSTRFRAVRFSRFLSLSLSLSLARFLSFLGLIRLCVVMERSVVYSTLRNNGGIQSEIRLVIGIGCHSTRAPFLHPNFARPSLGARVPCPRDRHRSANYIPVDRTVRPIHRSNPGLFSVSLNFTAHYRTLLGLTCFGHCWNKCCQRQIQSVSSKSVFKEILKPPGHCDVYS